MKVPESHSNAKKSPLTTNSMSLIGFECNKQVDWANNKQNEECIEVFFTDKLNSILLFFLFLLQASSCHLWAVEHG